MSGSRLTILLPLAFSASTSSCRSACSIIVLLAIVYFPIDKPLLHIPLVVGLIVASENLWSQCGLLALRR